MQTKHFLIVSLFLALTLMLAQKATCEDYYAKFGTSDKEIHVDVEVGKTGKFEVARISNEGTLNLTVTASWIPNYNSSAGGITLTFYPNNIWLTPGHAMQIYGEVVEATMIGTYSGIVDFKTQPDLPAGYSGSATSPGGSAHATFNVIEATPASPPFLGGLPLLPLIVGICGSVGGGLGGVVLFRRHRHNKPHKTKMPKLKPKQAVKTLQTKPQKKTDAQDILALLKNAEEKTAAPQTEQAQPEKKQEEKPQKEEQSMDDLIDWLDKQSK